MHELDPHKVRLILYLDGVDTLPLSGSKKNTHLVEVEKLKEGLREIGNDAG